MSSGAARCAAACPAATRLEVPAARPRATGHPAVHERLDQRAEGRDDPRPGADAPTSTPACEAAELADDDVMVSWLPLYHDMGLVGFLAIPMTTRRRPRAGRAAGLPGPPGQLDAVDLRLPRHRHRRAQLRLGAGDAGAEADEGPRPVDADARAVAAPSRSTRTPSRRSSRRPRRSGSSPAACSRRSAWPRWPSAARSRRAAAGLVCDTVDRVVLERERVAKPVDIDDPDDLELDGPPPPAARHGRCPAWRCGSSTPTRYEELPERHVGELLIRGTSVTPGYYKRPDATAALFHDGWLCTGDLAYLLDGELVLCGRIKDVIIVGGRNVFPEDIERAVGALDGRARRQRHRLRRRGLQGQGERGRGGRGRGRRDGRRSTTIRDADPPPHARGVRAAATRRDAGAAGHAAEDVVGQAAAGQVPRAVPRRDARCSPT